jgi:hypothetical protein
MAVIGNAPFQGLVSGGNILDASIEGVDLSTSAIAARLGYTPVNPAAAAITGGTITGLSSPLPVASGGTGVATSTGSGNTVLSTSPTLVTPALGTPSALVGTNITGTATAFTASNVTTNANLTGVVTSVGNATSLGSFTSAQLAAALTDETGSGANVFANTPTLVTPVLGVATATSLQGIIGNVTPAAGAFTTVTASTAIGTASGGTGLGGATPFTSGGVVYASSSSALATGSALTFSGTSLGINGTSANIVLDNGGAGGSALQLGTSGSSHGYIGTLGSFPLLFQVNGIEAMRIGVASGGVRSVGIGYTSLTSVGDQGLAVAGNVGIGTSNPLQKLHVNVASGSVYEQISSGSNNVYVGFDSSRTVGAIQSNNALTFDVGSSYTQRMVIDTSGNLLVGANTSLSPSAGRTDISVNGSSNSIVSFGIGGTRQGYLYAPSTGMILASETGTLSLQTAYTDPIQFNTNGSERVRISSDGTFRVKGAGTAGSTDAVQFAGSAPASALSLDSGGNLILGAANPNFQGSSSTGSATLINNSGGAFVRVYGGSHATRANFTDFINGSSTSTFDSGGKFGLGTNLPTNRFTVADNSASAMFYGTQSGAGDLFALANSASEKFRITNAGNVGIGTSSPVALLDVSSGTNTTLSVPAGVVGKFKGSITLNSLSTAGSGSIDSIYFQKSHGSGINISNYDLGVITSFTGNGYTGGLDFYTGKSLGNGAYGATFAMRIDENQNVGIGETSPGYKLELAAGSSSTGQMALANFRTGSSTASYNAGLMVYATGSATAASRSVVAVWDADGANSSGGDYFLINKAGSSGAVDLFQYSNAPMRFAANYVGRGVIDMTLSTAGNLAVDTTTTNTGFSVWKPNATTGFVISNMTGTMNVVDYTTPSAVGVGGRIVFGATYFTAGNTAGTGYIGTYKEYGPDNSGNEYNHSLTFGVTNSDFTGGYEAGRFQSNGTFVVNKHTAAIQKIGSVTSIALGTGDTWGTTTSHGIIAVDSGATAISFRMYNGGYYYPLTLTSTGNLNIANGNLVIGTAGKGIDFSADGNNAGMTSELLDDYEEGTFTPTVYADSGSGITYNGQTGKYTKIGNVVHYAYVLSLTSKGSMSGDIYLAGLPFEVEGGYVGSAEPWGISISYVGGLATTVYNISGWSNNQSTIVQLRRQSSADLAYGQAYVTASDISNSFYIQFSGTYRVS